MIWTSCSLYQPYLDNLTKNMHTRGGKNLVHFVRPVDQQDLACEDSFWRKSVKKQECDNPGDSVKGESVRSFYESLVSSSKTENLSETEPFSKCLIEKHGSHNHCPSGRCSDKSEECPPTLEEYHDQLKQTEPKQAKLDDKRAGNELLKAAQNGDLIGTQRCVEKGVDIDFQDSFGWTALMSASCGGHCEVVEYLLSKGSNSSICDKMGISARDLAIENNRKDIVGILKRRGKRDTVSIATQSTSGETDTSVGGSVFYCSVCKSEFKDTSEKKHSTSTLHLFNLKLKAKTTSYFIPESNRGFQMMVKGGWNVDQGLGSDGQGRKFPVQTVLKRDRQGLGSTDEEKSKPKVTHFSANDEKAVKKPQSERKMRTATLSKKKRKKKESKEKEWERKLRIYMNTE